MEAKDAWMVANNAGNAWKLGFLASIAMWAHPMTRPAGKMALSYMTRVTLNAAKGAASGALSTPLVRTGRTPGQLAKAGARKVAVGTGAVAAGYGIGAAVGTGIAYAGWGKSGAGDAIDLYSGQVGAKQYYETVSHAMKKTF